MATILMKRRWRWIGHVTRQEDLIVKTVLHWKTEGKLRRGRRSEDLVAVCGGERTAKEDQYFSPGEGPAKVKGSRCCHTRHPQEWAWVN